MSDKYYKKYLKYKIKYLELNGGFNYKGFNYKGLNVILRNEFIDSQGNQIYTMYDGLNKLVDDKTFETLYVQNINNKYQVVKLPQIQQPQLQPLPPQLPQQPQQPQQYQPQQPQPPTFMQK
jgi:hypothetical protein